MPKLTDIYNSLKIDESNKKAAADMAELLSKDVEQLASGDDQEVLDVRGRKFVIPKTASSRRTNTILIACLYALENPAVDEILKSVGVRGYFVAKDGSIELRGICDGPEAKAYEKHEPRKPGRNILIGGGETEQKPNQIAAVYNVDGHPQYIGTIHVWNSKGDAPGKPTHHIVKTVEGNEVETPISLIKMIHTCTELADLSLKISQKQE